MNALPKQIVATIAPQAIKKTSRFFNSSLDDIFVELFQNSRRANATRILVHAYNDYIIIEDDGDGIADPSRWSATISPDGFQGKEPVLIHQSSIKKGTRITINAKGKVISILADIKKHARYLTIPVALLNYTDNRYYKSQAYQPEDFLQDAIYIQTTSFGRIGVLEDKHRNYGDASINFFGCTLRQSLPSVSNYRIKLDITKAQGIELVLPSRKEIMKTPQWDVVLENCLIALYTVVLMQKSHSLSYKETCEARELGVNLPDAIPLLNQWHPTHADSDQDQHGKLIDVSNPKRFCKFTSSEECSNIEQLIDRAFNYNDQGNNIPVLVNPNMNYKGFKWYDDIPEITDAAFSIHVNGQSVTLNILSEFHEAFNNRVISIGNKKSVKLADDLTGEDWELFDTHWKTIYQTPERISVLLTLSDNTHHNLDLDILTIGDVNYVEDAIICIAQGDKDNLTPEAISSYLIDAFFRPNFDGDNDSYHVQYERFDKAALNVARKLFMSAHLTQIANIEDAISTDIRWMLPDKHEAIIHIDTNSKPRVELLDLSVHTPDNPSLDQWADAIASRISDESSYEHDDKTLLEDVLKTVLKLSRASTEKLIGPGIIEDDYFRDI